MALELLAVPLVELVSPVAVCVGENQSAKVPFKRHLTPRKRTEVMKIVSVEAGGVETMVSGGTVKVLIKSSGGGVVIDVTVERLGSRLTVTRGNVTVLRTSSGGGVDVEICV